MSFPSAVESVELGENLVALKVDIDKKDHTSVEAVELGDKLAASTSDLKIGIENEDPAVIYNTLDLDDEVGEERDTISDLDDSKGAVDRYIYIYICIACI
jgi:hypothetical protein